MRYRVSRASGSNPVAVKKGIPPPSYSSSHDQALFILSPLCFARGKRRAASSEELPEINYCRCNDAYCGRGCSFRMKRFFFHRRGALTPKSSDILFFCFTIFFVVYLGNWIVSLRVALIFFLSNPMFGLRYRALGVTAHAHKNVVPQLYRSMRPRVIPR